MTEPIDEYFIVRQTDEGLSVSGPLNKEELLRRITPDETHGETHYGYGLRFLDQMPFSGISDRELVIIKGRVVVPTPKTIVTKYDL